MAESIPRASWNSGGGPGDMVPFLTGQSGGKYSAGDAEFELKYRKILEEQKREEEEGALMRALRGERRRSALEQILMQGRY